MRLIHVNFQYFTTSLAFGIFLHIGLAYIIEELPNTHVKLGDGPHWRYPNLYYADLITGNIVRYDSLNNKTYKCQINPHTHVSFIIPYRRVENLYAVSMGKVVAMLYWDGKTGDCRIIKQLFKVEFPDPLDIASFVNDGKCDRRGRLLTGTANCRGNFQQLRQNLYKYADGRLEIVQPHVNMSNGMAWNDKRREFYYVDSGANTITRFDYDIATGTAVNPKVVFTLDTGEFARNSIGWIAMDGMTIDTKGFLYVAVLGGKAVIKICTRKWRIVRRFHMPCSFVTAPTFGGAKMDTLYVTSAGSLGPEISFPRPCGAVFHVRGIGATGFKPNEMV